jgi:hypothetical protein
MATGPITKTSVDALACPPSKDREILWDSGHREAVRGFGIAAFRNGGKCYVAQYRKDALCWTDQCFAGNGAADVRAVLDVQHGREPRAVVNRDVFETAAWRNRLLEFRKRFAA